MLREKLRECFDASRSGYVKEWKLSGIVHTLNMFTSDIMRGNRLNKYLHGCLDREGIDSATVDKAQQIIEEYYAGKENETS